AGGVAGEDPLAYGDSLDVGAHRVDDGDPLEPGAGREMRCDTGVVAPYVEQIGGVDGAEPDLHPHLVGAGLWDGLLGDGQNVGRFSVMREANGMHLLSLSVWWVFGTDRDTHDAWVVRKRVRIAATAAGCSTWGQWPAWATWAVRTLANRGATTSRIISGDEKVSPLP